MSKAQRIRQLMELCPRFTTGEVARIIRAEFKGPCSDAYVRTCARQRILPNGSSKTESRYRKRNLDKVREWQRNSNERYRKRLASMHGI